MVQINPVSSSQTQNTTSAPDTSQETQSRLVRQAQQYAQTSNTASSTHNLYHEANLVKQDPAVLAQQIIRQAKLDKDLYNRKFSEISTNLSTNSTLPPDVLDDMYSKLLNLKSSGHLKGLLNRFYNRRARKGQITDQAYGSSHIQEDDKELTEKEKVKRKESHTINESINDVIQDTLGKDNTPVMKFLLLSMAVQNPSGDTKFDQANKNLLEDLYKNHGIEIRAKINSLDDAHEYGNNELGNKKINQFSDTYYELVQLETFKQIFAILNKCEDKEFENITNLMKTAANKDANAQTMPTSDPNTIHYLVNFMHMRSSVISFTKLADAFKLALSCIKNNNKRYGGLFTPPHPKKVI